MRLLLVVGAGLALSACVTAWPQPGQSTHSPSQRMATTVIREWPAGMVSTIKTPGQWGYEEGLLLDGMVAEWHTTADGSDFAYVKAAVDKYVATNAAGEVSIKGYKAEGHTLDDIEMGRALLVVYRVTQDAKYAKAARFLHEQLAMQPRTGTGEYWHKQIYPNQVWLDSAYMAEPFRAMYAATFAQSNEWDDVANQLLSMDEYMRDAKTGLLRHGRDESKQMPWADKQTGLSPEVWGRAMGWYCMALVDVLDWFPRDHPRRKALEEDLRRTMAAVLRAQDPQTGLWWQVMTKPAAPGNYLEASASCMFVYAFAKGVRTGILPQAEEEAAQMGWQGIQKQFISGDAANGLVLHGTVKVGGLGGTPYRSGDFSYYTRETVGDQDAKGVGAFLLAGSEMEQAPTQALGQGRTVLMDGWFNSQKRKDAFGAEHTFHYKWQTDSNEGDSFFGYAFRRYGVQLGELDQAPTAATLNGAQVYVIVSPDNLAKNSNPHYMDKAGADAIAAWVQAGGVLLLMSNDRDNTEFEHFNMLASRFGIHFNPELSHHVIEPDHSAGEVLLSANEVFPEGFKAYMKDTSTITVSARAKAIVTDKGDVMIAIRRFGKGAVLGVVDPWFYNEYADGRKMAEYQGYRAAQGVAGWAVRQTLR